MRAPSVRLFVCLAAIFVAFAGVAVTASDVFHSQFTYHLFRRDRGASCNLCYGNDCWELQRGRCEYFLMANRNVILENGGATELDRMMYDMMDDATLFGKSGSCIPFISEYTDCNKDNICTGCRRCVCDGRGVWLCNVETNCQPEDELVIDHRMLVGIIENLSFTRVSRRRRWVHPTTTTTTKPNKIMSDVDVAEWMYGVQPDVGLTTEAATTTFKRSVAVTKETTSKPQNVDYMDLDELLNTIGLPNNKRRKPQLNDNYYNIQDLVEDVKIMNSKNYDEFVNLFNGLEYKDTVEKTTKVFIDLLASVDRNDSLNLMNVDADSNNDLNNDLNQLQINIMKREVPKSNVTENATELETTTTTTISNANVNVSDLTEDVLNPLYNIIAEKDREIKYLLQIKNNLERFIKSYNETNITLSIKNNNTENNDKFSIYKVDFYPDVEVDLRKINPDNINKLLYKLKRDIFEAVRDIKVIQKISKIRNLPPDLQTLITAMKSYIHIKGHVQNVTQNETVQVNKNTRRQQFYSAKPINLHLIDMMRVLEKKLPSPNVLVSLSPTTAKIIKRVIKNNYFDDMSMTEFKMYDPEYNLTNHLRNVGTNWNRFISIIDNSEVSDLIYALKLLHIGLARDIAKIVNALSLVNFAHSRRMVPVEGRIGADITEEISRNIKAINDKILIISSKKKEKPKVYKKKSFLRKLKDFLKGSRKEIERLVANKVPKPDIIKKLANKRLSELNRNNDYEYTMRKWQDQLNIIPHRYKRSLALDKLRNRMKNIIPKYLRGKLNPAIVAKRSKKSRAQRYSKDKKKANRKKKQSTTKKPATKEQSSKNNTTTVKTKTGKTTTVETKTTSMKSLTTAESTKTTAMNTITTAVNTKTTAVNTKTTTVEPEIITSKKP